MGFLFVGDMFAQTSHVVVILKKNSSITINGTSNISKFRFSQSFEKFIDRCFPIVVTKDGNKLYLDKKELLIPVKGFVSKNKIALRDFYKFMNVENHPDIRIHLHYIELQSMPESLEVNAFVDLTIAGVTRGYKIPVNVSRNGDDFFFLVNKEINILDFDLTPPTHLMNTIKVHEWININMNVALKIIR